MTSDLVVPYAVTGLATPGADYASLPGTATIAAGSSFVDIIVAPVDDTLVEGDEDVTGQPHTFRNNYQDLGGDNV